MEKYIESWNVVSRTYIGRLQREGVNAGMVGGMGGMGGERAIGGQGLEGKELF